MLLISKYSHAQQREVLETHYNKTQGWEGNFMRYIYIDIVTIFPERESFPTYRYSFLAN